MSSSEDENGSKARPAKKQRVPKIGIACDRCRKRKIQCDGRLGGAKCRYCTQNNWACEYLHAKRKYQVGYVKSLENKMKRFYRVLQRLHPDEDFTSEVGRPLNEDNWPQEGHLSDVELSPHSESSPQTDFSTPSAFVATDAPTFTITFPIKETEIKVEDDDSDIEDEHAGKLRDLTDDFTKLTLGAYQGRHSTVGLIRSALNITFELTGARLSLVDLARFGRPAFWKYRPWDCTTPKHFALDFPAPDLLQDLIALYFERQNALLPVIHRPTFMRLLSKGLQDVDFPFACVVLLVCANGARYSNDPRVFLPGAGSQSAGWPWFNQVRGHSAIHSGSSRLFDLQAICLSTMYLMGAAATQASWVWCGHGIRLALDIGAHKKKTYDTLPTAEDEQYKRVFWVLILLDKHLSICMARPYAVKDEDLDLDLPTECDDEYWDLPGPSLALKQPEGRPSRVGLLVYYIKLQQAIGPGLCLIFSGARNRAMFGALDGTWERPTVANLDSRMNMWAESVPNHLRWDPNVQDDVFLSQSAHLWTRYHELQIILHRPFISPRPSTPKEVVAELGFPSLAICLSAARSIVRIIECIQQRFPGQLFPFLHDAAFLAGMMLFLGIWGSKKFGVASRTEEDLSGIHTCERFLETLETRMHPAGRHRDVMHALLSLVEVPPPVGSRGQKRPHDVTQTPEIPAAESSAAALASLDDWFAGTQFEATQPALQPIVMQTNGYTGDIGDPASWTASEIRTMGAPNTLFATLGYGASVDEHVLPLDGWNLNSAGLYDGQNDLDRLFGLGVGAGRQ
ncbi:hypothetical protein PENSPDRAFT_654016 [Peniophora sp. CONT]|nr:hypothetical protein PENSPDRAFT_654016 [Peniophora sp. CONT]